MAEAADVLAVSRKKTLCFFLYSSIVRNFSCSAWKSRTTSPPFRMFSTFSLCSKKRLIFQLVWELTTLTSLHPGISRSSWLAATCRTFTQLIKIKLVKWWLTCCPALTGVRMTLSPTTTLSPLDLSCKNKISDCGPASQACNQVWGYVKSTTIATTRYLIFKFPLI